MRGKVSTIIVLLAALVMCGLASPLIVEVLEFLVRVLGYVFLGPIQ